MKDVLRKFHAEYNMELRIARYTADLKKITYFYHDLLGLKILGSFEDHNQYDGIFLGFPDQDWHLEFIVSNEPPRHEFDEDDLLVFYFDDETKLNQTITNFNHHNIQQLKAKNPYWNDNGFLFSDPDGYGILLTIKH